MSNKCGGKSWQVSVIPIPANWKLPTPPPPHLLLSLTILCSCWLERGLAYYPDHWHLHSKHSSIHRLLHMAWYAQMAPVTNSYWQQGYVDEKKNATRAWLQRTVHTKTVAHYQMTQITCKYISICSMLILEPDSTVCFHQSKKKDHSVFQDTSAGFCELHQRE